MTARITTHSIYPGKKSRRTRLTKAVSYLLMFALTFSPLTVYSATDGVETDTQYAAAASRLDEFMGLVTALREDIDRSAFDTDALLEKLDFDANNIIRFVTQEIAFEQYRGLLRGAQGTLMSGAGNALDQSLLLAKLLNDGAYDSRIVQGKLEASQAEILVRQMGKVRNNTPPDNRSKYESILSKMAKLAGIPDGQIELFVKNATDEIEIEKTVEYEDAVEQQKFILDQLHRAGEQISPVDVEAELEAEAGEYYWVEYRDGPSDKWTAIHPAFSQPVAELSALVKERVIKGEIPEELQHRFRVEFFLEQKVGDKLTSVSLMKPVEMPAANLVGKSLQFVNVPDGLKSSADIAHPQEVAKNTNFMIPVFKIDQNQVGQASYFDMNGILVDAATASNAAAGLFQTLGNKVEGALGATSVAGTDKTVVENFRAISAQWIEFTRIFPGGREDKVKRYVIDRIGAQGRETGRIEVNNFKARGAAIWKLATTQNFSLTTGSYPEAYIFHRYLNRLLSARPLFERSLQQQYYPDEPATFNVSDLEEIIDFPSLIMADSFNRVAGISPQVANYHHEPSLVMYTNSFNFEKGEVSASLSVDIVNNEKRVLSHQDGEISYAAQDNILSGTWATRLEELDSAYVDSESVSSWNTRTAFAQARRDKLDILVMKPNDLARASSIAGASSEAKQAILADLKNGYHVIIPEGTNDPRGRIGWWRVNTQTGDTLGMINEGLGGEVTKYSTLIALVSLGVSVVLAIPGYMECRNKPQPGSGKMCSLAGCLQGAGIGVLIGTAVGYSVGLIAAALAAPGAVAVGTAGAFSYAREAPEAIKIAIEIGVARGMDIANAANVIPQLPSCIE